MPTEATYTIADLARLTGVNVRTIRYYVAQGLIPSSGETGRGARYGDGHLHRLRLVRMLQAQHLPLAEIRLRLQDLGDEEVERLIAEVEPERGTPPSSALDYVREVLGTPAPHAVREVPAPFASGVSGAPASPAFGARLRRMVASSMPAMRDVPPSRPDLASEIRADDESPSNPATLERSQWERLSLGPNLELHVRRPLSRLEQRRVERLITIARQVLKEDMP